MLDLVLSSSAPAIGVFVGVLVGLFMRKRSGRTEGLLKGSVVLTAAAAGLMSLAVMMTVNLVTAG
ncbi:MAG: hypothetical protein EP307_05245 [Rhodobacteraceae bacterium]|nr:MAG: hypothetical protein EP307_05245 [Paracoccaceae bacterium]